MLCVPTGMSASFRSCPVAFLWVQTVLWIQSTLPGIQPGPTPTPARVPPILPLLVQFPHPADPSCPLGLGPPPSLGVISLPPPDCAPFFEGGWAGGRVSQPLEHTAMLWAPIFAEMCGIQNQCVGLAQRMQGGVPGVIPGQVIPGQLPFPGPAGNHLAQPRSTVPLGTPPRASSSASPPPWPGRAWLQRIHLFLPRLRFFWPPAWL